MWDTLYYTPERAQQMDFVIYFRAATGGLVAKGNPKKITGLDNVCGIRAAAALGSVEEKQFHDFSDKCVADGKPAVEVVVAADIPAGFRAVMNDRADLFLINLGLVDQMVADNPDKLERSFMILTDYKVGVGAQQAEPGARQGDHGRARRHSRQRHREGDLRQVPFRLPAGAALRAADQVGATRR